jgi:flagellar biosynthesis chaperone FliJ
MGEDKKIKECVIGEVVDLPEGEAKRLITIKQGEEVPGADKVESKTYSQVDQQIKDLNAVIVDQAAEIEELKKGNGGKGAAIDLVTIGVTKLREFAKDLGISDFKKINVELLPEAIQNVLNQIEEAAKQITELTEELDSKKQEIEELTKAIAEADDAKEKLLPS